MKNLLVGGFLAVAGLAGTSNAQILSTAPRRLGSEARRYDWDFELGLDGPMSFDGSMSTSMSMLLSNLESKQSKSIKSKTRKSKSSKSSSSSSSNSSSSNSSSSQRSKPTVNPAAEPTSSPTLSEGATPELDWCPESTESSSSVGGLKLSKRPGGSGRLWDHESPKGPREKKTHEKKDRKRGKAPTRKRGQAPRWSPKKPSKPYEKALSYAESTRTISAGDRWTSAGTGPVIEEIVGGNGVNPRRKYKFFASLDGCAGSLIASNVVLTAAHCGNSFDTVALGMHARDVEAGDVDEFSNVEHIPIKQKIVHPCWDPVQFHHDVMILELQWSTEKYKDDVVELDSPDGGVDLFNGKPLSAMGFGNLFYKPFSSFAPNIMQEVTTGYDAACGEHDPADITDDMLCAGDLGEGACQGDSGGPLIDPDTQKQVGIVSWGVGCGASGLPDLYARVSYFYDWIQFTIADRAGDVPAPAPCVDETEGWYAAGSPNLNCLWYAANATRCAEFGDSRPNGGLSANDACCACATLLFDSVASATYGSEATIGVTFEYDGTYEAAAHGPVAASVVRGIIPVAEDAVTYVVELSGAAYFRAAIPPGAVEEDVDLDLYLVDPLGNVVDSSENPYTAEFVEVLLPADGVWTVEVYGAYYFDHTTRIVVGFDLYSWTIPRAPGGGMSVVSSPPSAELGAMGEVVFDWPEPTGDEWLIGAVSHTAKGFLKGLTLVTFALPSWTTVPPIKAIDYPWSGYLVDLVEGEVDFPVTFGYTGDYVAAAHGFVAGTSTNGTVAAGEWAVHKFDLFGEALLQAYLPQILVGPENEETLGLGLFLVDPSGQLVAKSAGRLTNEWVEVDFPEDGTWSVYVDGTFLNANSTDYQLLTWVVSATPGGGVGDMTVTSAPDSATAGATEVIDVSWEGLTRGVGIDHWFVGAVSHTNETGLAKLTVIEVDNWIL